jgi:hypothetical protein
MFSQMKGSTFRVAVGAFLAIALVGACLWYVTAPPKGEDGYRERAAATAETLVSQVESARLWAVTEAEGKALTSTTLVGLEEAEEDAASAASQFEGYEPPDGVDALRARLVALAGEASEVLSSMRIAAQRERWDEVLPLSRPLPGLSRELSAFEERAEP